MSLSVTSQETECPRAWLSESTPGIKIGLVPGECTSVGVEESRDEGNALEDRYVEAVKYFSLHEHIRKE